MQDLSSLITRDQTCAPCIGWTAGGALVVTLFSRMILTVGLIGSEHVGVCGQGDGAGGHPLPGGEILGASFRGTGHYCEAGCCWQAQDWGLLVPRVGGWSVAQGDQGSLSSIPEGPQGSLSLNLTD